MTDRPSFGARWAFFVSRVWDTTFHPRAADIPRVPNDGAALRDARGPTVTWIGHSTVLLQLDGVNVLTDPQWSERASPVAFGGPRRVTPPGLALEALPPIHAVLLSHDHYDHLDLATLRRLHAAHHPAFVVPRGLGAWLLARAISDVTELRWWESRAVRGVTVTCLPARHFSGRTPWDTNRRLWSGWAVAGRDRRFFFAGDTAWDAVFEEVGERLGPFDLAAVPIGAYVPARIMHGVHVTPEEALRVFTAVRARHLLPIHWGTFDLAEEPLDEPPVRLEAEARRLGLGADRVWLMKIGETRAW